EDDHGLDEPREGGERTPQMRVTQLIERGIELVQERFGCDDRGHSRLAARRLDLDAPLVDFDGCAFAAYREHPEAPGRREPFPFGEPDRLARPKLGRPVGGHAVEAQAVQVVRETMEAAGLRYRLPFGRQRSIELDPFGRAQA